MRNSFLERIESIKGMVVFLWNEQLRGRQILRKHISQKQPTSIKHLVKKPEEFIMNPY